MEVTVCRNCGKELTGAIETMFAIVNKYVFIVQRETDDCNWTKCTGCRRVVCKRCRSRQQKYCCIEGRIIDHERARAAAANGNGRTPEVQEEQEEETQCPITESFT